MIQVCKLLFVIVMCVIGLPFALLGFTLRFIYTATMAGSEAMDRILRF